MLPPLLLTLLEIMLLQPLDPARTAVLLQAAQDVIDHMCVRGTSGGWSMPAAAAEGLLQPLLEFAGPVVQQELSQQAGSAPVLAEVMEFYSKILCSVITQGKSSNDVCSSWPGDLGILSVLVCTTITAMLYQSMSASIPNFNIRMN
jgi:hypothetical protein